LARTPESFVLAEMLKCRNLTCGRSPGNIWSIPVGIDQKGVIMTEIFVGIALLAWVVLVLIGTGANGIVHE
jgi:hypothetical protein